MPELPEVETIARSLRGDNPYTSRAVRETGNVAAPILGKTILGAEVHWAKTIAAPERGFPQRIKGQKIENIGRRAKYLVINLDRDHLVIHLRMSGDILLRPAGEPAAAHDRVVFHLSGDTDLAFNDTRKFGRVWLLSDTTALFSNLGPEPFSDAFTGEWLYTELHRRKRQIKPLLLDQHFLAGVGNIYADESLHRAGIHPRRLSNSVSEKEAHALRQHIQDVLREGIENNGASIDWVYRGGEFQNKFRVFGRDGENCQNCGTEIIKIVVGQRGTHLCPSCQLE